MNKNTKDPQSETKKGIYHPIFLTIVSLELYPPIRRILGTIIQAAAKAIIAEVETIINLFF